MDFAAVKKAFERNYACMEVRCEDIGGLWFAASEDYYEGAEPCPRQDAIPTVTIKGEDKEVMPSWAVALIAIVSALFVFVFLGFCYLVKMEKSGKPIFLLSSGKSGSA